MKKVKLNIVGLSYSQTQSGAYALVLEESETPKRRLPIIIGGFEAQAIAIELEKMAPSRPLTHDLFKSIFGSFQINLIEVVIYNLQEGVFFAKLICQLNGETVEIDARTSDSIAIAVRMDAPIYTFEKILDSAGIKLDDADMEGTPESMVEPEKEDDDENDISLMPIETLNAQLDNAIENENYELASKLRDEINRRSK